MMAVEKTIYLDHAATTPVRAEVLAAMLPYFSEHYGNASSLHGAGRRASVALTQARRMVAAVLGARPAEIIFTGGATESDNAALRGIALARRSAIGAQRIVTTAVEHHAVLTTAEALAEHDGFELTVVGVDREGRVRAEDVAAAVGDGRDVAVVSVMLANNEVGTVQPVAAIGAVCHALGVPLHTDAVQAAGRLPLNVQELQVDALTLSGHKMYGPKGVGVLYLRGGTPFRPVLTGGSHEQGRRAGTENVPLIVGMAKALELADAERPAETARLRPLRDRLIDGILASVEGARLTGATEERLANHASFVIGGVEAEGVLIGLDMAGIAASSGSACTSGAQRPSHVLEAMGIPAELAVGGLRLTLGHSSTAEDVDTVLAVLPRIVEQIRGATPVMI
jgi:cysteine desulfurase